MTFALCLFVLIAHTRKLPAPKLLTYGELEPRTLVTDVELKLALR